MARLRQNLLKGVVDNAPLAIGDLELESTELADMQVVVAPDIMAITLDPLATNGPSEIIHVTAHAAASTTATIVRAQEDSDAREHPVDTKWLHGPTKADIEEGGTGGGGVYVTPSYDEIILADDPFAYWPAVAGASPAEDVAGPNDLVYSGTAPTVEAAGGPGTSLAGRYVFAAVAGHGVTAATFVKNAISVEAWVKISANPAVATSIISFSESPGSATRDKMLFVDTDGKLVWHSYDGSPHLIYSPAALALDVWHHVVGCTGADGQILYIDGVEVATNPSFSTFGGAMHIYMHMGGDINAGNGAMEIAGPAVYDYQLEAATVEEHFNSKDGGAPVLANFAGHTVVDDDGVALPNRTELQFPGSTVTDDVANDRTVVTIPSGGASGEILAILRYQGAVDTNYHDTGAALVDVDAANVFVTFDAPASGNVLVNVAAYGQGDPKVRLGLREGAVDVAGPQVCTTDNGMLTRSFYVTGLAAGSHTLKLAFFGGYIFYGPTEGAVEMTVLSAP